MNKNIIRIVQAVKGTLMLIGAAALILSMVYTIRGLFKSQDTLNAAAKSQSSAADSEPNSSGFLQNLIVVRQVAHLPFIQFLMKHQMEFFLLVKKMLLMQL